MLTTPFTQQIAYLVGIDIALSFVYGFVPVEFGPVREMIALVQLGFMAVTMAMALRWVLEDF